MPRRLFGTAGIRKKYPDPLDPVLAYKIGLASAYVAGRRGRAYLVYDTRTTSQMLATAFSAGLMAGGMDVYWVGLAPTPVAAYAAKHFGKLGVSVTASHNPPEYNGFKLYDEDGFEFVRELESQVEELVESPPEPQPWDRVGRFYKAEDIVDLYIEDLVERLRPSKIKWSPRVVLDLANGAAYRVTPEVVRRLGAVPVTVNANPDGYFPGRHPEPRKDVLEELLPLYRGVKPAMILAHDGDADRLAVLDPVVGFIRQDRIIALYAHLFLQDRKGLVVVTVDTGRVVDEVVERAGGKLERYVLGKTHERVKELGGSVVMAAEPWKLIDPRWGPWVDGVLQAGVLTSLVVEYGKPLVKILDELGIPDYPWDRRSYAIKPAEYRDKLYEEVVQQVETSFGEPSSVLTIDGYRYEYDDGSWILVRKSGTEPKIRVYVEAPSAEKLKVMVETVEEVVAKTAKRLGVEIVERSIG